MKKALINTARGAMTADLYENEAPGTVANFIKLSKQGYYNGLAFHRVIPSFVIQGGCPYSKDMTDPRIGTGGPGYSIDCELDGDKQYHDRGVLSMAHSGKNTGGSQFFICHNRQNTKHLDRKHTCFGIVTDGIDIVDAIRPGDVIKSIEIIEED